MPTNHQLRLYNSLGRRTEDFVPAGQTAGLYSCGPTVYSYPHLGNMRAYVFADTLRRALRWKGTAVRHVVNITDVGHAVADSDTGEDKLEVAAARERRSVLDIAAFYTDAFFVDLAALNILPADEYPRASAYVEQMIEFADKLDKDGFTYQLPSGLYFDTSKDPGYGELAQMSAEGQLEAARARARGGPPPQDRLRAVAGRGARPAPGAALGLPVGLGRARLAPGVLGDEHGPARPALRHPHRRGRPPRAAPRQRDRAEPGVPRRRPAVGAVLAAQRVPAAGRARRWPSRRAAPPGWPT